MRLWGSSAARTWAGALLLALSAAVAVPTAVGQAICAAAKLELGQEAALEREGFTARLSLTNNLGDLPLSDLRVDVVILDSDGLPASHLFFVGVTNLEGTSALDGTGTVQPAGTAKASWLIVPSPGAGGTLAAGVRYTAQARMTFHTGGVPRTVTTFPVAITVKPQPLLKLEYVLPFEVFGDEPFTPVVESTQPFPLGLRVSNIGAGTAKRFTVESSQPKITDNQQGLAVDFSLLGTWLGSKALPDNTFLINFGDIPPGGASQAAWSMTSSLSGRFTDFTSTFTHAAELGGALTSLIESVTTYTLVKDVLVDLPGRDAQFDFLINVTTPRSQLEDEFDLGREPVPEYLMESDRAGLTPVLDVPGQLNGTPSGTGSVLNYQFLTAVPTGTWVHSSIPLPSGASAPLVSVTRADGKTVSARNAWVSRHFDKDTLTYSYFLHVLDYTGETPETYAMAFDASALDIAPDPISDLAAAASGHGALELTWTATGEDGSAGAIFGGSYKIFASTDPAAVPGAAAAQVAFTTSTAPGAAQSYRLSGLIGNATYFVAVFLGDGGGSYSTASNTATACSGAHGPQAIVSSATETSLLFSWSNAANLPGAAYRLTLSTSGGEVASTGYLVDASTYEFTGLSPDAAYSLTAQARNLDLFESSAALVAAAVTRAFAPTALPFTDVGESSATANWATNGNPADTAYRVDLSTLAGGPAMVDSGWIAASSHVFVGLTQGQPYFGTVRARNRAAVETASADLGTVTVNSPDSLPPVTSLAAGTPNYAPSTSTLYAAAQTTFSLSAVDEAASTDQISGVAVTYLAIDTTTFSVYAGTFSLIGEGEHLVSYYSVDAAGNVEPVKTSTVSLDITAPNTTLAALGSAVENGAGSLVLSSSTPLAFSAVDPISSGVAAGMGSVFYRLDGSTLSVLYTSSFTLTSGEHSAAYFAEDNVLNREAEKTSSLRVLAVPLETVLPVLTGVQISADGTVFVATTTVLGASTASVRVTVRDAVVGLTTNAVSAAYSHDGGLSWTAFPSTAVVMTSGGSSTAPFTATVADVPLVSSLHLNRVAFAALNRAGNVAYSTVPVSALVPAAAPPAADAVAPALAGFLTFNSTGAAIGENQVNDKVFDVTAQVSVQDAAPGLEAGGGYGVLYTTRAGQSWIAFSAAARTLSVSGGGIYGITPFNGKLYAGSLGSPARIYESPDGVAWTQVFSSTPPSGSAQISNLTVFNGRLYASYNDGSFVPKIYSTADGTSWTLTLPSGGQGGIGNVYSLGIFNGALFAGTDNTAQVYATTNGSDWLKVLNANSQFGAFVVMSLSEFNGRLYAGTHRDGRVLSTPDGVNWSIATQLNRRTAFNNFEAQVYALTRFNGRLFAAANIQENMAGLPFHHYVYSTADGTSWSPTVYFSTHETVQTLAGLGGLLYAGTHVGNLYATPNGGAAWLKVTPGAAGDPVLALAADGGTLHAGTASGVYRLSPLATALSGSAGSTSAETLSAADLDFAPSTNSIVCGGTHPCGATDQVWFAASDLAGNIGHSGPRAVQVNTTPPVFSLSQVSADGFDFYAASSTVLSASTGSVRIVAQDLIVGLSTASVSVLYSNDGGANWTALASSAVTVSAPGSSTAPFAITASDVPLIGSLHLNRVAFSAANLAGNIGSSTVTVFSLLQAAAPPATDATGPTVSNVVSFDSSGAALSEGQANDLASGVTVQAVVQDLAPGLSAFGGYGVMYTTTAGRSWIDFTASTRTLAAPNGVYSLAYFNGKYYAGLSATVGRIYSSVDGVSWSLAFSSTPATAGAYIPSMAVYNGKLYAAFNDGSFAPKIYSTADGTSWTLRTLASGAPGNAFRLAVFNGALFAGTDNSAQLYATTNGDDWTNVLNANARFGQFIIHSLAAFRGKLYAGTYRDGRILSSPDGVNWTQDLSLSFAGQGLFAQVTNLTAHGGRLYAAADIQQNLTTPVFHPFYHYVYSSADGTNWAPSAYFSTREYVTSLESTAGKLYAGTNEGGLYASPSAGAHWVSVRPEVPGEAVNALLARDGRFVAGTGFGASLLTPLATTLTGGDGSASTETLTATALALAPSTTAVVCSGAYPCSAVNQVWLTASDLDGNVGHSGARAVVVDTAPPTAVFDLSFAAIHITSLTLSWTSPAATYQSASYDLRRATFPITAANFNLATPIGAPSPVTAGAPQTADVAASTGPAFYAALKTIDSLGGRSLISNIAGLTRSTVTVGGEEEFSFSANQPVTQVLLSTQNGTGAVVLASATSSGLVLVSSIYDLGPEGAVFNPAAILQFRYSDADLAALGLLPSELSIYQFVPGTGWVAVASQSLDSDARLVTASIPSLSSIFALFGVPAAEPNLVLTSIAPSSATTGTSVSVTATDSAFDGATSFALERLDAARGAWSAGPSLSEPRANHGAALLDDGRLFVIGGQSGFAVSISATTEFFDPATDAWTAGPSMAQARYDFSTVRLKDGRLLVVAGRGPGADLTSVELYSPASNTWTTTGSLTDGRSSARAVLLPDGRVLVAGGYRAGTSLSSVEIYDPASGAWSAAAPMSAARQGFVLRVLRDGRVLAAGGSSVTESALASAEVYDPATNAWTPTGAMTSPRSAPGEMLLPDGRVLAAGGYGTSAPADHSEIYDPATGAWTPGPAMTGGYVTAFEQLGGRPTVFAGYNGSHLARVESYDAGDGAWRQLAPLATPRVYVSVTRLRDGRFLAVGGELGSSALTSVEVFSAPNSTIPATGVVVVGSTSLNGSLDLTGAATGYWDAVARSGARVARLDGGFRVLPAYFTATSTDGAATLVSPRADETVTPVSTQSVVAAYGVAVGTQNLVLAMSYLYELSPSPVVFSSPALLSFLFDPTGVDLTSLAIYRYQDPLWSSAPVTGQVIEVLGPGLARVSGTLASASLYGVFYATAAPADTVPPLVRIDSPSGFGVESAVGGVVTVAGAVADASAASWTLAAGSSTLASGAAPASGALASWDTAGYSGHVTLTLSAQDAFGNAASTSVTVFVGDPAFAFAMGRKDSDVIVAPLKNPTGIVVRSDGLIWVAKTGDEDGLLLLSSSGTVLAQRGGERGHGHDDDDEDDEEDEGAGLRFKSPQGLALDAAGNLYVADKGHDRVLKLSPDGAQVLLQLARVHHGKVKPGSGPGEFRHPWDVAVDGNGDLYVADSGNRRIQVFDASGTYLREFAGGVFLSTSEIRGIALSAEGLWVSDKELSKVYLFSRSGAVLKTVDDADSVVGEISRTRGLATDRLGNLYVVEPNRDRVQKFDSQGRGQLAFGPRSEASPAERAAKRFLTQPLDAAMAPDGSLWVSDTGRDRVVRYALPSTGGFGTAALFAGGGARSGGAEPARRLVEAKDGARVERDDGTGVSVPEDALATDLEITVDAADAAEDAVSKQASRAQKKIAAASEEVEYGPEGTRFTKPVTLTISYDPAPGLDESKLKIHYWNPSTKEWEALDSVVDPRAKTVSAQTTHFSVYQVQGAGSGFVTAAAVDEFGLRDKYVFPNPSRRGEALTFRVQPGLADSVELRVYDLAGRKVHSSSQFTLTTAFDDGNGKGAQHTYDHVWNVSGVGSGVYHYVIVAKKAGLSDIIVRGKAGVIK